MSGSATRSGDGVRYRATHTARLPNIASKFERQRSETSPQFFCHQDPESPMFALDLRYGRDPGFFGVFVVVKNDAGKALAFTMQKFRLYDDEGKVLKEAKGNKRSAWIKSRDSGWGFSQLYKPIDASKETAWRIFIEFEYEKEGASLPSSSPSSTPANDLQTDLLKLLDSAPNTDVTFIVQGESIKAHKSILAVRSQYFQRMFESDVEENITDEVKVPDIEPEVFRGLLQFLYSGLAPKNVADKAFELLLAADKYGVDGLIKICEDKASIHLGNVVDLLLVADGVHNEKLMTRAKAVFRSHVDELMASNVDTEKLKSRPALLLQLIAYCAKR